MSDSLAGGNEREDEQVAGTPPRASGERRRRQTFPIFPAVSSFITDVPSDQGTVFFFVIRLGRPFKGQGRSLACPLPVMRFFA